MNKEIKEVNKKIFSLITHSGLKIQHIDIELELQSYEDKLFDLYSGVETIVAKGRSAHGLEAVRRSFNSEKPASNSDKGIRDSLIWLSIRDYLLEEKGTYIFISGNKNDFANETGEVLHPFLQKEIDDLSIDGLYLIYYKSIGDFLKDVGDGSISIDEKDLHNSIDEQDLISHLSEADNLSTSVSDIVYGLEESTGFYEYNSLIDYSILNSAFTELGVKKYFAQIEMELQFDLSIEVEERIYLSGELTNTEYGTYSAIVSAKLKIEGVYENGIFAIESIPEVWETHLEYYDYPTIEEP